MKKIIALLLLFFVAACSKYDISKTERFTDNRWNKDDVKTFIFKIEETYSADVMLLFSHISEPQYNEVPLEVVILDPSGKKETVDVILKLKEANGKQLSDCAGDVCDLTKVIKERALFEKGSYTVTVKNNFNTAYLPNVLAVGVSLHMKRK